jgi:hypothetical protein
MMQVDAGDNTVDNRSRPEGALKKIVANGDEGDQPSELG